MRLHAARVQLLLLNLEFRSTFLELKLRRHNDLQCAGNMLYFLKL
jgi:hypothetical protein